MSFEGVVRKLGGTSEDVALFGTLPPTLREEWLKARESLQGSVSKEAPSTPQKIPYFTVTGETATVSVGKTVGEKPILSAVATSTMLVLLLVGVGLLLLVLWMRRR